MNWEKIQIQLDNFIRRYRMAIIGTLLAHAFFMFILILIEISKPEIQKEEEISVELAPDIESLIQIPDPNDLQSQNNEDNSDLKNISANAADQNKSFDDFYREAENILDNSKPKENFKANDYADKRWLAKDYSKENTIDVKDDIKENKTPANNNSNNNVKSNNTYAGKAIITYNLNGRKATRLPVPAYQCLGSGEVIIEITVNQKGIVSSAVIISSKTSLNEDCLAVAAKKSALQSKFAIDLKASAAQKGTINYKFVQQ